VYGAQASISAPRGSGAGHTCAHAAQQRYGRSGVGRGAGRRKDVLDKLYPSKVEEENEKVNNQIVSERRVRVRVRAGDVETD